MKVMNEVMTELEESGLTLNYDKCQIGVSSMEYIGNCYLPKDYKYLIAKGKPLCRHQDQRTNKS